MVKLRRYVLSHLSILFFSIFLPLFAIASVIFLIKLATYTAVIQLSIMEMGKLYLFALPELLFYTLPISFVVSAVLTLYRLSNDNEMIVVFSLGISPTYIARILSLPAFFLSILLLINFIVITPYIKIISNNFLEKKRAEAKFNLAASEFGHHFGEWMLFINKSNQSAHYFEDIVLFNNKTINDEIVLKSDKAELINQNGTLQLKLMNGISYSYNNQILQTLQFNIAYINDEMSSDPMIYRDILNYWTNDQYKEIKQARFITNTLLSLFPLISIYLIIALGIVHARHHKRWIYLWLFVSIIGYYVLIMTIQKWIGFHAIWTIIIFWLILSYGFYKRLVGNRF